MRWCRLSLLAAPLLCLGLGVQPALAQQAGCAFQLGFQTLHDLDPADVGACVDNQAFTADGDAQQHTTKGLMVWRKADNWTAFTNGYTTWINGPDGLVQRLNTQRFPWEGGPAAAGASAPAPPADMASLAQTMRQLAGQLADAGGQPAPQLAQILDQTSGGAHQLASEAVQAPQGTPDTRQMIALTADQLGGLAGQLRDASAQLSADQLAAASGQVQGLAAGAAHMMDEVQAETPASDASVHQAVLSQMQQALSTMRSLAAQYGLTAASA